jgi:hypothetical protein
VRKAAMRLNSLPAPDPEATQRRSGPTTSAR